MQRFVGTKDMGFRLSDDGVIVRNAFLLLANGYGVAFLAGTNQDISNLASAKALMVRGFYGGTASAEADRRPIVLAYELRKGA